MILPSSDAYKNKDAIALISAPWPLYNRPSIQLGTLKSSLATRFPRLRIHAHHMFLYIAQFIGYPVYKTISQSVWPAETVYAKLLYPDREKRIRKVFEKEKRKKNFKENIDFDELVENVKTATDCFMETIDPDMYFLAGFSVSLCQLCSTLYIIREMKRKNPRLKIVTGGSMFSGRLGLRVPEIFPDIDYVISGEGEKPMNNLVEFLLKDPEQSSSGNFRIPGVIAGGAANSHDTSRFDQLEDLSQLPLPDYDDYFDLLHSLEPGKRFFPVLLYELSRGCRRKTSHHPGETGGKKGCAFCNLNLQWNGYRMKTAPRAASEIEQLSAKHKLLQFSFVDNLLPAKITRNVFQKLREQKADYSFFGEFRAGIKSEDLLSMRNGGLEEIQVGIEALSTRLLKKMNKGTSAIDNLEIMKNCEELGIFHDSNLILQFPGSELPDVEETLENLDFAFAYRPLKTIAFWLGYGSPVWEEPGRYGIRARFNHPFYSDLFPRSVSREIPFIIQSYRGDIQKQRKLWEPVKQKVRQWSDSYRSLRRGFNAPILSCRDGKDFLIIRKRVKQDETQTHRLTGSSRNIYLFCRKQRSLNRIVKTFPAFSRSQLENFLRSMVEKKLMFSENDRFLSLAVSRNPFGTSGEKC